MLASRSLRSSPISKRRAAPRTARPASTAGPALWLVLLAAGAALAAMAWAAVQNAWVLGYGDAEAHLNIARRLIDSRTPGPSQIGTVWLPLPHLLMAPLVRSDWLWRSGLAGTIVGGLCHLAAAAFLYLAVRQALGSTAAACVASLAFAWNPNALFLAATPMTEPIFFACALALLWTLVRFSAAPGGGWILLAGGLSNAAALTRYEGWFLIPLAGLWILFTGGPRRWLYVLGFASLASQAPLLWLAHNWWYYGNALEFYNGPYSAKAIYERALAAGMARAPGDHNWAQAWRQLQAAARHSTGQPLLWAGALGAFVALVRRAGWPVLYLAAIPAFYVLSTYSGSTNIFVPDLWPFSYYNTRYGLSMLPLSAFGLGALVACWPWRARAVAAVLALFCVFLPWLTQRTPEAWICWKESRVNSASRRAWTAEAAQFLAVWYRPQGGIFTSFGDLTGIFRQAGIPLKETLHEGNAPAHDAALARPEFFLHEEWAVAQSGDRVATAIQRLGRGALRYERVKLIAAPGAPVIEIYRRLSSVDPTRPPAELWVEKPN